MFFSPAYVQRYGESFLLGLPGYRVERLSDGGIFYQLSRSLLANNEREAAELRTRVTSYCAAHDVAVTCHAPYILPSSGEAAGIPVTTMENQELIESLKQAFDTTFALDDGTRVKSIYLPWSELKPEERELALTLDQTGRR